MLTHLAKAQAEFFFCFKGKAYVYSDEKEFQSVLPDLNLEELVLCSLHVMLSQYLDGQAGLCWLANNPGL